MKVAIMPDGTRVSIENANYRVDGALVIIRQNDGGETVYKANNEAGAAAVLAALDVFVDAPLLISADPITSGGGFTWTSITPAVATFGISDFFVIEGTGFAGGAVNNLTFFQGALSGPGFGSDYWYVTGDTTITTGMCVFDPVGVWTLYYSTDAGGTWTTTALTVTVS